MGGQPRGRSLFHGVALVIFGGIVIFDGAALSVIAVGHLPHGNAFAARRRPFTTHERGSGSGALVGSKA